MRIVFVAGSLVHGGAERQTVTLVNRLAERGHACHLAYLKEDQDQLDRVRGAASVRCVQSRRYIDFGALRRLARLIAEVKPAAVVAANEYALLYAWIALRLSRTRAQLAVTFHATLLSSTKQYLQVLAYRPLFWSAERVVFVCEGQRQHWRRRALFGRRDAVIYNGVDTEHWSVPSAADCAVLRRALGFAPQDYVVGISAVLRPEKNHVQLVEAIARLRGAGVPARALMIGDGETRPAVEALARRRGVERYVSITGFQRDVRPFVAACDVMALTSRSEAFSLAAVEAMACARPVVHPRIGGAAEMIEHGENGFIFPVGDTAGLVKCLGDLAEPGLRGRMGRAARDAVEQRFSERAMVDRYELMLQELETERNRRANIRRPAGAH